MDKPVIVISDSMPIEFMNELDKYRDQVTVITQSELPQWQDEVMEQIYEDAVALGTGITQIKGKEITRIVIEDFYLDPEPCQADYSWEPEPIPKPVKTKLRINQAPRQSFRQSMRSVNRNR